MKTRSRFAVVLLLAIGVFSVYVWPSRTLHTVLSSDVLALSMFLDHGSMEAICASYFDALAAEAPLPASSSTLLPLTSVTNHVEHLRIFNRCYIEKGYQLTPAARQAEQQLLPFFSELSVLADRRSFLNGIKQKMDGRGIVVSISDAEVGRALNLLRVLNHLGNELPIQFVHLDELSEVSVKLLRYAAMLPRALGRDQRISFVNVGRHLASGFDKHFKGYNRKWFAAIFTSFKEMILMDADSVPYVPPSSFFDLEGYQETGAYFFRDRELNVLLKKWKIDFYKGLLPNKRTPFGFEVDSAQLHNNFFLFNSKHVAESGVVVMDRETHLLGLVIPVALLYFRKSSKILYGDKDLFWFGQLISGNSNFTFHYNTAGAMGQIEPTGEVCLAQIAHYGNNTLLWTNGGLTRCKKRTWVKDYLWYSTFREQYGSIAELRESYNKPVEVSEIIIPAVLSDKNEPGTGKRPISNFNKRESRGCAATYYCANAMDGGRLIILDSEAKAHINTVIDVWNEHHLYGNL